MTDVLGAFLLGVLSAASLGLGVTTARIWKPTNFVLGLLTAFGAGALLSAVTIDIVAPSVEVGEFGWLAVGAVAGGLAFEGLNRTINARGGFLRKASTSITFLRDREQRRKREILDDLERIDVFEGLPDRELDAIADAFRTERLDAGETLYRFGDPCDHLNVLAEGEIALTTRDGVVQLHPHQAFGHLAFVTGTQHRSTAIAKAESEVLRLSHGRLRSILGGCPTFAERLRARTASDELLEYLRSNHSEIGEDEIERWRTTIQRYGIEQLPPLVEIAGTAAPERVVDRLADAGPFRGVSHDVLVEVAQVMFPEEHDPGYVFFRPGEVSDRIYVVSDGEISLVHAASELDATATLEAGDEFGSFSVLTGMHHTATAITHTETDVWVLRHADLAQLVDEQPELRDAIVDFVESPRVASYLRQEHGLDPDDVTAVRRRSVSALRRGSLCPVATMVTTGGAPIAIWLGLLLDAIPESLVIGATAGSIRVSFVVGIFLSNYPEALASSVGMREHGLVWRNIGWLWATVILITGLGAALGSVVFQKAPDELFAVVEGVAAGAMLTVITQTMMPEALDRSGGFVGLAALGGFLFTTLVGA
ncbi:MAG: cyclic nucleotide-binding domain-containing protein [Ilumatobacter sp.]|uniref:cyclic nucleotide-binding domain-containing protein n=1 Tax=Ilumatobacter sp. TaxID=1967498 RepID=UPI0026190FFF|nr:cyclic nucleotide-binding domain-containing protein [Ilumatobacter sp.]MDJ0768754.1 cyclic nucleotide-binding domain-containing protein [Ilumatobacter sp.]